MFPHGTFRYRIIPVILNSINKNKIDSSNKAKLVIQTTKLDGIFKKQTFKNFFFFKIPTPHRFHSPLQPTKQIDF